MALGDLSVISAYYPNATVYNSQCSKHDTKTSELAARMV